MLTAPVWRLILQQGLPMAVGMACHALFNLVDLLMVGRLGADAVAGIHVATTINFLPMIVGNGFSVATIAMMSQWMGAGKRDRARALSSWSQVAMLVLGLVLGLVGVIVAVPAVDLQGVTGDARHIGIHYLVVTSAGTVTMFGLMQATATMRAEGEGMMPFALLVGANLLNLVLDVVLLFGWKDAGIPAFGAPGAAYATVIARGLGCIVAYLWLLRPSHPLPLSRVRWRPPGGIGRQVVRLGVPTSVQMLSRAVLVILVTRLAGELGGSSAIVALGVTTRLDTMVLFASLGFASAATAVGGRNFGAGQRERARWAGRWAGAQAVVFGTVLVAAFARFAPELIRFFVADAGADVIDAGTLYLRLAGWAQPLAALCIAVTGASHGAGRMIPPMLIDLVGYLAVFTPIALLVVLADPDIGLAGLWWLYLATNAALAVVYARDLERGRWLAEPAPAVRPVRAVSGQSDRPPL